MEEEKLAYKLEFMLQQLFSQTMSSSVIKAEVVIEEFSDSDDDY